MTLANDSLIRLFIVAINHAAAFIKDKNNHFGTNEYVRPV
jgi:hypothetical protein